MPTKVSIGSGMIAGLELCLQDGKLILADKTPDSRFAADVNQWNSSVSLNTSTKKKRKDAKK